MADIFESSTVLRVSFNEADGTTVPVDSSALANTLVPHGSAVINTGTSAHYAVAGNLPAGSWYEVATDAARFSGDFTIESWVCLNSLPDYPVVWSRQNGAGFAANFGLKPTGPEFYFVDSSSNSFSVTSVSSGAAFAINTWHHVEVCRAGSGLYIFLDGILTGTSSCSALPMKNISGQPDYIGRIGDTSSYFLDGRICDLRITSAARNTANFIPPAPFGLPDGDPLFASVSLLLKFDGTDGATSVVDQSPYGRTMTRIGSPALKANIRKFGTTSAYFSSNNDAWYTPADVSLDLGTDFSIEAWIYQLSYAPSTAAFLSRRTAGTSVFLLSTYSAGIGFEFWEQSGTYNLVPGAGSPIPLNQWVHVRVCRIGNTIKTYRNGALEATMSDAPLMASGLNVNLYVGRDGTSESYYFPGYIDDVRITKGIARSSGPFTPPDSLPYYSSLTLLPVRANWFGRRLRRSGFDGSGRISGTTKLKGTPTDTPVGAKVRLIREVDGLVVGEVWSNPVTGDYVFDNVDMTYKYTVVSYDPSRDKRAVIADNLTPLLIA